MRWPEWKWRAALLGGGWLIGVAGCGPGTVQLPSPPLGTDVAALAASYQNPTAVLDTTKIQQTYMDVTDAVGNLPVDWLPPLVADALNALQQRLQAAGLPDSPTDDPGTGAKITGYIQVKRICNGWDSSATADEAANGSIQGTAVVQQGKLLPTVWATASQCRAQVVPSAASSALSKVPSINASLDGTLEFYVNGQLGSMANGVQALVVFQGMASVGDHSGSTSFDLLLSGGTVAFKVSTDGGYVVVTLMGATLQIDGANAGFSCDIASASCQQNR